MSDFNGFPDPNGWAEQASAVRWRPGVLTPEPAARILAPDGRWWIPGIEQIATERTVWLAESRYPDENDQFIYSPLTPQWAGINNNEIEVAPGSVMAGHISLAQIEANNLRLSKAPLAPGAC